MTEQKKTYRFALSICFLVALSACQQPLEEQKTPINTPTKVAKSPTSGTINVGGKEILSIMRVGPKGVILAFNSSIVEEAKAVQFATAVCESERKIIGKPYKVADPINPSKWPRHTKWLNFHCK